MITLATFFTLLRIMLVPSIVSAMIKDQWIIASVTFFIAALTDMLDGLVARWYKAHTILGAYLDAVADKILLIACFGTLAWIHSPLIQPWFVWLIVIKELVVMIGALFIGSRKGWDTIRPTVWGKMVTCTQLGFIILLFVSHSLGWQASNVYSAFLICLAILITTVLAQYAIMTFRKQP